MATSVRSARRLPPPILQLHIELRGLRPKVWRRVLVPETITLARLHCVIQAAFGWTDSHLHDYVARDGLRYGVADPLYDDPGAVASERTRLTTALRESPTLDYVYDFGDDWVHRIKPERTYASDAQLKLPLCVDGAGARPPEDCGGTGGYLDFLHAMADVSHPEHADMKQWCGRDSWDPAAFDVSETNLRLATIKL